MSDNIDFDCTKNCLLALEGTEGLELYQQSNFEIKLFKNRADLLKAATECRADILKTVNEKKPRSLYELAKLVKKNQAYIYRETKVLEELGLVEFIEAETGGRKRVRPQSRYSNVVIHL